MTRSTKRGIQNRRIVATSANNNNDDDDVLYVLKQSILELGPPAIAGTAAFAATLALSAYTQLKVFGISTGTMAPIPSIAGVVSVAAASLASQAVSIKAYQQQNWNAYDYSAKLQSLQNSIMNQIDSVPKYYNSKESPSQIAQDMKKKAQEVGIQMKTKAKELGVGLNSVAYPWKDTIDTGSFTHAIRVCVVGMLLFKCLGGRFWSISPSSFTNLGSFARVSIPATDAYATEAQRGMIERLGRRFGCHTCGSHMIFATRRPCLFHADHMPPRSVAKQINSRWYRKLLRLKPVKQRFYPQCVTCSNQQGKLLGNVMNQLRDAMNNNQNGIMKKKKLFLNLANAGGGKNAHFHSFRPRISHLTGGAIATFTMYDANHTDIIGGNKLRFSNLQDTVISTMNDIQSWFRHI